MSPKQRLELRRSEIRGRLGHIAALAGDVLTEAITTERDTLMVELRESEPQLAAAIVAEASDETRRDDPEGGPVSPEMRERLALREKAKVGNFLVAALRGRQLSGPEAELAEGCRLRRQHPVGTVGRSGSPRRIRAAGHHSRAGDGRRQSRHAAPRGVRAERGRQADARHADGRVRHLRERHDIHGGDRGRGGEVRRRSGDRGGVHRPNHDAAQDRRRDEPGHRGYRRGRRVQLREHPAPSIFRWCYPTNSTIKS